MGFDPTTAVEFDPTTAVAFDPTTATEAPTQPTQRKSSWSNAPAAIAGMFNSTVDNGTLMQPARWVAEHLDVGQMMPKIKAKYPGQTDDWYQSKLHDTYGNAVTNLRQQDQAAVDTHPYPGHQVGNTAVGAVASFAANPELMLVPGANLSGGVAKGIATNAARFAAANAASDAAAQGMDMMEGQKKDFDVTQNLTAAGMGGVLGGGASAIHAGLGHPNAPVPDFVKDLFKYRGMDTTPNGEPSGTADPLTTGINLNPEEKKQFSGILRYGTVDDIKNFLADKQGPKPTWQSVNDMVQMRDDAANRRANRTTIDQAFDESITDSHRQLVSDHIDNLTKDWKNKPDVEVLHSVDDIADPEIKAKAVQDGINPQNTVGWVGPDGKVRIFASAVDSPEKVNAVLYHEALGHYGLAQRFGNGLDSVLDTLAKRNVGQFGKDVDAWQKANPDAYGGNRTRAAEEVLAEMSQSGPLKPSLADALMAHVKRFGRQMGLKLSYSDGDVQHILAMAHDAVINGKGMDVRANNFGSKQPNTGTSQWLNFDNNDTGNRNMSPAQFGVKEGNPAPFTESDLDDHAKALDMLSDDLPLPDTAKMELKGRFHQLYGDVHDEMMDAHSARLNRRTPDLAKSIKVYDNRTGEVIDEYHNRRDALSYIESRPDAQHLGIERAGTSDRYMTPNQLNKSISEGDYKVQQMEQAYHAFDKDYVPTNRPVAEVQSDALAAGFSPTQVKKFSDVQDLSKRVAQLQGAAKVLDARMSGIIAKFDTPAWSEGDKDAFRQALLDHNYILTKLWGTNAEIARAHNMAKLGYSKSSMQSFGELLRDHGGTLGPLGDDETLNRFARSLKGLLGGANPNGVNALVKGLEKPNWEDYLTTFHQNMMLSGLSTHVKAPLDMMIGIGRDLLDHAGALPMSAARDALRALGVNVKPGVDSTEVAARMYGILRSALDANTYKNTASVLAHGGVNPNGFGGKESARIPVVSKVTDLISAQDTFFRAFATNMHLYGLGTRRALEEARANGTPKDWDTIINQGSNYARAPDPQMLSEARALADQNLLLNKNALTAPLDKLKRTTSESSPLARVGAFIANFLTPFVRVESNSLYNRVIRRTPLALLDPQTVKDISSGGAAADVAMARIIMGTATIAAAWSAYEQKKTTADGPDDYRKKQVLEATGWRPNAVHEDGQYNTGNKLAISFNPLDVHNQTASLVADLHEAYDKGANKGQVLTGIKMATYSSLKTLADMSWINDIAPAVNAFTAPNATMSDKMDQFLAEQAGTMAPNAMGQLARTVDQGQPETQVSGNLPQTIANTFKSEIPGQRETLPKRIDPLGGEVQSGATGFGQHTWLPQSGRLVAGNHVNESTDPAVQEIGRLTELVDKSDIKDEDGKKISNVVSPVRRSDVKDEDGNSIKLTNAQLSQYQREVGQLIRQNLKLQMNTPEWSRMSNQDKIGWIRDMQTDAKSEIREKLYGG